MKIGSVNSVFGLSKINLDTSSKICKSCKKQSDSFETSNIILMEAHGAKDINFGSKNANDLKYKKILLKISGEALMGNDKFGVNPDVVKGIAGEIKKAHDMGAKIGIVVGGGNIFRGVQNSVKLGMPQAAADYAGMLATVMNGLVLKSALIKEGVPCKLVSALDMHTIAEPYQRDNVIKHLEQDNVVVFVAGTGNPFFTTDTAAGLRASEIGADALLMAKNKVDGIYDKDPRKFSDAKKLDKLSYDEVINRGLKVMDTAAITLCKQNKMPVFLFDFDRKGAIEGILKGQEIGSFVGTTNSSKNN